MTASPGKLTLNRPPQAQPAPAEQSGVATVTARNIKITLVLNTAEAATALQPFATTDKRIPMTVMVEGRRLKADFAPKAVRKVLGAIQEHGLDGIAILIQGKLGSGDHVLEAGLMAQPKQQKPPQ